MEVVVEVSPDAEYRAFHALIADQTLNSQMKDFAIKHAPKIAVSAKIVYAPAMATGVIDGAYPSLMTIHPGTGRETRLVATVTYEGPDIPAAVSDLDDF